MTVRICIFLILILSGPMVSGCGKDATRPSLECLALTDSLSFGPVLVGGSRVRFLILANSGTELVRAMPRLLSPDFQLPGMDSTTVLNVAPGDTVSIAVLFLPTSNGNKNASLIFSGANCPGISLIGRGEISNCSLRPAQLDFGPLLVSESSEQSVTLVNESAANLETSPQLNSDDFFLRGWLDGTLLRLAPGDSYSFRVAFVPKAGGDRSGLLTFSGGFCPEVSLQGWGDLVACELDPPALNFGSVFYLDRPVRSLRVTSVGTLPLEGVIASCGSAFVVEAGAGPFRLEPGENLDVRVRFQPPRSGLFTCGLDLGGNGACRDVQVTGTSANQTWRIRSDGTGDARTIQAGIDSAETGDIVLVEPGTYYENLELRGRDIVLKSESGPEKTVINGSRQPRSVIAIKQSETRATLIEGLTITGGLGETSGGGHYGGGIYIVGSSPTIRNNIISGNGRVLELRTSSTSGGGAIYAQPNSSPLIENNRIENNRTSRNGSGVATRVSSPVIIGNTIRGNTMEHEGDGGGIWLHTAGVGTLVRGNWIEGNVAVDKAGGMVLHAGAGSAIEVSDNVFIGNLSKGILDSGQRGWGNGGALWVLGDSYAVFNNTFVRNQGSDIELGLGGEILATSANGIIERNIIAFSVLGGGIHCYQDPPLIRDNVAWMNAGGHGTGSCSSWVGSNGNIEADPGFCDLDAGNVSVSADSPALLHPSGPIGARTSAGCTANR